MTISKKLFSGILCAGLLAISAPAKCGKKLYFGAGALSYFVGKPIAKKIINKYGNYYDEALSLYKEELLQLEKMLKKDQKKLEYCLDHGITVKTARYKIDKRDLKRKKYKVRSCELERFKLSMSFIFDRELKEVEKIKLKKDLKEAKEELEIAEREYIKAKNYISAEENKDKFWITIKLKKTDSGFEYLGDPKYIFKAKEKVERLLSYIKQEKTVIFKVKNKIRCVKIIPAGIISGLGLVGLGLWKNFKK